MVKVCDECGQRILNPIVLEITMGLNHYEFCKEECLQKFIVEGKGKYNSFYA